jgi:hypothetical protein
MALIEMLLTLQPTIDGPPVSPARLYKDSCGSDEITIQSWEKVWIDYTVQNAQKHVYADNSVLKVLGEQEYKPVILAGSGPSLKKNALHLKESVIKGADGTDIKLCGRRGLRVVSCLHNFNYFEDHDIMTPDDYYVTLDSGPIVIKEVWEGGSHEPNWYWERTKDRTLIAYTATHPELIEKWRGRILWFSMPPQSQKIMDATAKYVDYKLVPPFSVGGCVAGAALYFSRAILCCGGVIFIGMDFAFDYMHRFHAWQSPYDAQYSGLTTTLDIWGNKVGTWSSYIGFKKWFDHVACGGLGGNPQLFVNCTEGGIFGAYPEGNIKQVIQMDLKSALHIYNVRDRIGDALEKVQLIF